MTSTSGATLTVLKTAPAGPLRHRLHAQAEWLKSFDHPGIVKVLNIREDGYEMPYLHEPSWPLASSRSAAYAVLEILSDVHSRPAPEINRPTPWTWNRYLEKIDTRDRLLFRWWTTVSSLTLRLVGPDRITYLDGCDTHGDPTLENLLYDDDGTPVLVDPIPDAVTDGKMPSLRAVDLGKLLQSALGYELIKRGRADRFMWDEDIVYPVREYCHDENEFHLAKFFCAVHVARLIPYQTEYLRNWWAGQFETIATYLRDTAGWR